MWSDRLVFLFQNFKNLKLPSKFSLCPYLSLPSPPYWQWIWGETNQKGNCGSQTQSIYNIWFKKGEERHMVHFHWRCSLSLSVVPLRRVLLLLSRIVRLSFFLFSRWHLSLHLLAEMLSCGGILSSFTYVHNRKNNDPGRIVLFF